MRVVLIEEAEADLERIGDVIARDNPGLAITFVDELEHDAEKWNPVFCNHRATTIG